MDKDNQTTINISKEIAPVISSRDITDNLESAILKSKTKLVNLDFSDVEFVSRSAAHALLLMKENLHRKFLKKKDILFINVNEDIKKMFRIIAANRALPKDKPNFKPKRLNIDAII